MTFISLYIGFCITTAIAALIELLAPVISRKIEESGQIEAKLTIYMTFFLVTILAAPMVFFSCIVPSVGERFREALYKGLFPKE
ncbi:hypothetical protein UFOVP961_50 [uncultured Caudovirales phage]|uniref:Uncharacterized protein n=1 Tax=uncultured Caudovirales phage TaxID=2100421 RepID=A0A6J5SQH6_9CAUD|nr:hypothetical protein UFOVP961_50 [uncultured Caudovirales phage]CAB4185675.1 hypothetical protein UFOVP1123_120 [uncultured Caudovirales phage]CAB4193142.1 hypothetical protein UFOVP1239_30 [uncultured Caudovirales phage]CAB4216206.1 hypothetical protein UFOVP1484_124 [uncultured Caudovirales phage]CAB5230832.1 hypothetical protein UFOVP1577_130 [uncultured Caudovirales phage]